jgi:actin related protein 2/3 complex subunit 1A/1B
VAPNNSSDILIYETNKSKDIMSWKLINVIEEHNQQVSGLDWSAVTNKIISCGHDKNVIVYTWEDSKWTPSLVILSDLERAALCASWNSDGSLFGVGSGNKRVILGYYEENNNWWASVSYKVHDSSVIALSFHPNKLLVASASTDKKVVIASCYIAEQKKDLKVRV